MTATKPIPPIPSKTRTRCGYKHSMSQALRMQNVVFSKVSEDLEPDELAKLVSAWDTIEERKRILRNKPLPGVFKPETVKKKRNDLSNLIALSQAGQAGQEISQAEQPIEPPTHQ